MGPFVYQQVGNYNFLMPLTPQKKIAKPDPPSKKLNRTTAQTDTQAEMKKWAGSVKNLKTPSKIPTTSQTPRWKRVLKMAGINISGATTQEIIQGVFGEQVYLAHITFTVGGETNITFYDGNFPISGPMDFGGADEPRGAVMDHSRSPLVLDKNNGFKINSSLAVQVSGYVTYYTLPGNED